MTMPKFFFLKSKSNNHTTNKSNKSSSFGFGKRSKNKQHSNQKSKGRIFREKESSANAWELPQGLTWTVSEESCPADGTFDEPQTMKLNPSHFGEADQLFRVNDHQQQIESLKNRHGKEIAVKEKDIFSLKNQQRQLEIRHSKEIIAFEKILVNKEIELFEVKEQLIETKNDLFDVSATLIQTQHKLHDLSASWPYSFWSQK